MIAVVKVGTSSITTPTGELDDAAVLKLCAELAEARAAGHELVLVCSGAIAAGLPALGLTAPSHRHRRPAGRRRGGSAPAHGAHRRDPRPTRPRRRARCCSRRTTSRSAAQYLHAPRDAAPAARSPRDPDRERERHRGRRRDPLRRQRPARRPRVEPRGCRPARAPHRHRRAVHRRSPSRRRGIPHRGDRRGRRRARARRRRHGHDPGERRDGEQARRRRRSRRGRACGR